MKQELQKIYDAKNVEERLYQFWLDKKYFHAEVNTDRQPYTIVITIPVTWTRPIVFFIDRASVWVRW